jgi:orotate phosphoribosyltransferase
VLTEKDVKKILEEARALLSGHFKLSSGRHSGNYLQCAQVLQHPAKARELGQALADKCSARGGIVPKIHVVASPAVGGVVIGQEVALGLGSRAIFSERDAAGKMAFRRGFKLNPGENVLLADDVLTTGGSLRELLELVRSEGGNTVGVAALAERGVHDKTFPVPRVSLLKLDFVDYDPAACPLCEKGLPVEKPGSRPTVAK